MITIELGDEFKRQFRQLAKKYRSLPDDLRILRDSLIDNPLQGDDLGRNLRKVRVAIASKGKGKSGGARVITYHVQQDEQGLRLILLTIYDKSKMESISDSFILSLLQDI